LIDNKKCGTKHFAVASKARKRRLPGREISKRYKRNATCVHCVSKINTDVAHYNFNAHQPIWVIFGRDARTQQTERYINC